MGTAMLELSVVVILGFLALAIAGTELYFRIDLHRTEVKIRQEQMTENRNFVNYQMNRVESTGKIIAAELALQLRQNTDWAADALSRARLHSGGHSLFTDRSNHYHEEKLVLADRFVPMLLARCKSLVEQGFRVIILVDAGSTLVPVLERIARDVVFCRLRSEAWVGPSTFSLYTNSLAGSLVLMEHGRLIASNPYSDMAFDAHVLPGTPLATFAAVVGSATEKALHEIGLARDDAQQKDQKLRVIGLTTGNWVRIRQTSPPCPIPLARGVLPLEPGIGHCSFKQQLVMKSDEVYVLAPLGKIFSGVGNDEINRVMGYTKGNPDKARESYDEIKVEGENTSKIKLVTTIRPPDGYLLSRSSERLLAIFGSALHHVGAPLKVILPSGESIAGYSNISEVPHIAFLLAKTYVHPILELEAEFPHGHTRDTEILKTLFHLTDHDIGRVFLNPHR
jgi:hypothetical protein